ncbi:MAG: PAS domain S-box protein [Burkholderiales bacterium]
MSSSEGKAVFRLLVDALARILGTDLAFIALPEPEAPDRMRMLAFHLDGETIEDFAYPLAGTPCETVLGHGYRVYPERLCALFPQDSDFGRLGLDAYAGYPLRDAHGAPLGVISVVSRRPLPSGELVESMLKIFAARAVTEIERLRSDAALRTAEESYRAIFEAAEDPIFVHDWDTGRILDVNARACEVYGFAREEFREIGIDAVSSGVSPYTSADALRRIETAKRDGTAQFEWHRRRRDGSLHWDEVRLKCAVIGGQRRVLAFTREITQRKLAEEALRSREEQYRAIFDGSADAFVLWNRDIRIVDVNAAFTRMYGYARDEVRGCTFGERIQRDGVERRVALIRRALAGEEGVLEDVAVRKDGSTFAAELRYLPITYRGEPHVLAIGRDITERREAEAQRARLEGQLRQAQKMEAIGQLTGGIAHDFNNILTSVMGYTVLALERAQAQGDDAQVRWLQQTQRASKRARYLIQQMLTFSRGQRGEPRPLALAPIVRESLTLLRSTLPATIDVERDLRDDVPPVLADPVQLEQVLLNLCINARDAIAGTGAIRVTLRHVRERGAQCASCRHAVEGAYAELAVGDSGAGIPPAVADRMFEPFFTTKEVGKGSGMGLATVHGIVHDHHGHVVVESTPGQGSCFRVLLPVLDAGEAVAGPDGDAAAANASPRRLAGRVLVVDDEPMIADYLRELLTTWGLDVTVKLHPHDAVAWFMEDPQRVDAVITDQAMPRQSGLELARALTMQRPELPVLLHTGFAEDLKADDLARCGVVDVLCKPIEPAEFRAALARHLHRAD